MEMAIQSSPWAYWTNAIVTHRLGLGVTIELTRAASAATPCTWVGRRTLDGEAVGATNTASAEVETAQFDF